MSGSGISWAICKSAPRSRQITMPEPRRSVFYRPDALPAGQPTASKHWRHYTYIYIHIQDTWKWNTNQYTAKRLIRIKNVNTQRPAMRSPIMSAWLDCPIGKTGAYIHGQARSTGQLLLTLLIGDDGVSMALPCHGVLSVKTLLTYLRVLSVPVDWTRD